MERSGAADDVMDTLERRESRWNADNDRSSRDNKPL